MAKTTRALFIGNSFTACNNLPDLLSQLVAAGGKGELEHELISINGASLRTQLNKGEAQKRIASTQWDYVVLQEQSTLPIKNAKRSEENIRDFNAAIKETGTQTVLYMTWARQNAPETQTALSETYTRSGCELDIPVVPAGLAWQSALSAHPDLVLHDKDQSHPNLAACTFYATLFIGRSRSIADITSDLDAKTAKNLHIAALDTVRTYEKKGC